jgi:hypothetical protein
MKTFLLLIAALAVVGGLGLLLFSNEAEVITNNEDSGDSSSEVTDRDEEDAAEDKSDLIKVTSPTENETVTSPLTVTGEARGYWYFEASFPLVVTDWDGRIIGEGFAEAQSSWMTEDFVPFIGEVEFTVPPDTAYQRGTLILQKANASGLPENDDAVEISIRF